jgi:ankyrin repeat protein
MTCYFNNIELVKLLVDKCEVDINDTNGCGSTPIYISALNDFLESLQYLVEKGADINKPNFSNVYPLTAAVFYENWDCAIYLLKTGSDPNKFEPGNGKNYKFQKEFIMMYPDIFVKKFEKNRIHIKILREYEYIFSANKYNL